MKPMLPKGTDIQPDARYILHYLVEDSSGGVHRRVGHGFAIFCLSLQSSLRYVDGKASPDVLNR